MNALSIRALLKPLALVLPMAFSSSASYAASSAELDRSSKKALDELVATVPAAKTLNSQAGGPHYGYAIFFKTEKALQSLDSTEGLEVGVGPSVVIVDSGMATNISSNSLTEDIYAFVFAQKGLMAGAGLQGNKITRIKK